MSFSYTKSKNVFIKSSLPVIKLFILTYMTVCHILHNDKRLNMSF
ncbi:hypothetical protein MCHI_003480 [Candidatus Magnetoovum chiemensis]|nr:hypothetical protein MCHI_003480 [Candidatus Magnetoovum chiemensis]